MRAVPQSERTWRLLRKGDLLLEESGGGDLQPVCAVILYDHDDLAVCSNFVARMPVSTPHDPKFLVYLHFSLRTRRLNVRSIEQTTGIQNLDSYVNLSERVAALPPDEQTTISRYLDDATAKINKAIDRKKLDNEILREYRSRLIADPITGKIDVRDTAAELTDLIPSTVLDGNETSFAESNPMLRDNSLEKEAKP